MMFRKRVTKALKKHLVGRLLMKPLRWVYRLYAVPQRRRLLLLRGPEVLGDIAEIFKRHNINGFAAFGTLLGIVREKGFIKHDEDIDLGIVPGSVTPNELLHILLDKEQGFSFAFAFEYHGELTEFKVYYKGIPIDFFFFEDSGDSFMYEYYYWEKDRKYPNENANSVRRVYSPVVRTTSSANVLGVEFPVPSNAEEVLVGLYGSKWRIPNAKWSEDERPRYERMDDFGYSIELDDALGKAVQPHS